jgi:hypothetical protein
MKLLIKHFFPYFSRNKVPTFMFLRKLIPESIVYPWNKHPHYSSITFTCLSLLDSSMFIFCSKVTKRKECWSLFVDYFFYFSLALYVLIVFTCSIIRDLTQTTPNELVHCHGQKCALNIRWSVVCRFWWFRPETVHTRSMIRPI